MQLIEIIFTAFKRCTKENMDSYFICAFYSGEIPFCSSFQGAVFNLFQEYCFRGESLLNTAYVMIFIHFMRSKMMPVY